MRAELPDWVYERLAGAALGRGSCSRSGAHCSEPAPLDLRVNTRAHRPEQRAARARRERNRRGARRRIRPSAFASQGKPAINRASAFPGRRGRSAGRRQPAHRLSARATPPRSRRRFLRRRRRQVADARRNDAFPGARLRVRRLPRAARAAQAAPEALRAFESPPAPAARASTTPR